MQSAGDPTLREPSDPLLGRYTNICTRTTPKLAASAHPLPWPAAPPLPSPNRGRERALQLIRTVGSPPAPQIHEVQAKEGCRLPAPPPELEDLYENLERQPAKDREGARTQARAHWATLRHKLGCAVRNLNAGDPRHGVRRGVKLDLCWCS